MKRLIPYLIALVVLALIAVITRASGAWFGSRWLTPTTALSVLDSTIDGDQVDITVYNHRLWLVSGDIHYQVVANGETRWESPPLVFTDLPARTQQTFTLPFPPDEMINDMEIVPFVRERIAYVDAAPASSAFMARIGVVEPDQPARILSASLTRADDGTALLTADIFLMETSADAWQYRYALSVGRAVETNNTIQITERSFLSSFTPIMLIPAQPFGGTLSESLELPAGDYAILLWLQADSGDGSYEHYAQFTYPQVFTLP